MFLFFFEPAVHRDRDHLPRNELFALLKRLFRRHLQPAAAGNLHAHNGHASDVVVSDDLRQLFGIIHAVQLGTSYGKTAFGVVRCTYIIDESGMIEKAMPKVKPDTNAAEILEYLEK